MNVFDAFAGCGGLSLGLEQAGLAVRWATEWDKYAADTFLQTHPSCTLYRTDAREILRGISGKGSGFPRRGEVDVLAGGPPCQGFCQINRYRDFSDERNSLVEVFFELVRVLEPTFVLMENVTGILTLENGAAVKSLLRALGEIGYNSTVGVLQCGCFGLPQNRWRVFVMASKQKLTDHPKFPVPTHSFHSTNFVGMAKWRTNVVARISSLAGRSQSATENIVHHELTVRDAIADLPATVAEHANVRVPYASGPISAYQFMLRPAQQADVANHSASRMQELGLRRCQHIPAGGGWLDLPDELKPKNLTRFSKRKGAFPSRWGRLEWGKPFSAIVTKPEPFWGRYIHPDNDRLLSVRECARAQSFPDAVEFKGPLTSQFRQVGNAVPPLIAMKLALELRESHSRIA